jgi:hypothetical protein
MRSLLHPGRLVVALTFTLALAALAGCATEPSPVAIEASALPAAIPFTIEFEGLPIVELGVGDRILRLAVDTGADRVSIAIKPSALREGEIAYNGRTRTSADVNGKKRIERGFVLREARLGALPLRDLQCSEELRDFVPVDGIIGNAFLSTFTVVLDYRASAMTLEPRSSIPPAPDGSARIAVPFTRGFGELTVECSWRGGRGRFCLDTGAAGSGLVHSAVARRLERNGNSPRALLQDFSIGRLPLGDLELDIRDLGSIGPFGPPFDGIIGYAALKDRRAIFDFRSGVIYFE